MERYELSANYDTRASFYNKANVEIDNKGKKTLISYNTKCLS